MDKIKSNILFALKKKKFYLGTTKKIILDFQMILKKKTVYVLYRSRDTILQCFSLGFVCLLAFTFKAVSLS